MKAFIWSCEVGVIQVRPKRGAGIPTIRVADIVLTLVGSLPPRDAKKPHQSSLEKALKPRPATTPLSTVTIGSSGVDISRRYEGQKSGRAWRQVAGPKLSPSQFHCATVPDGGAYERIEAENRAVLKAHFAKLAKECLIHPHHPPVNIVGGYRFPDAPAIDLSPVKPASLKSVAPVEITGDGLDFPEFLRRTVAATKP
jgi:hypothetical protein